MVINVHGDDGHAQEHDKDLLIKNRADDYLESQEAFGRVWSRCRGGGVPAED